MSINLTLIAQALAFAGFIWLIATFVWPPLLNAIEERQKKIAEGLAAADNSQRALAQAQETADAELNAVREHVRGMLDALTTRVTRSTQPVMGWLELQAMMSMDVSDALFQHETHTPLLSPDTRAAFQTVLQGGARERPSGRVKTRRAHEC